ncbi:MAG: hypothetical protein L0332_34495 [Chloroflexi bacterium]|nr:hypothetical protein [Chloroflexota bacterium]
MWICTDCKTQNPGVRRVGNYAYCPNCCPAGDDELRLLQDTLRDRLKLQGKLKEQLYWLNLEIAQAQRQLAALEAERATAGGRAGEVAYAV